MTSTPGQSALVTTRLVDSVFIAAINWYQKRISPRKGWRCAYGRLHGGQGCSGYIKSAIQSHGWRAAYPLARERFQQCKLAGQQLRAQSHDLAAFGVYASGREGERRKRDSICEWLDFGDWCCCSLDAIFDTGPCDSGCIPCTPCD